ncbi:hypothetical protein FRB95_005646 [Tulasnella sp. JGI-2019a]|nr:hypothetical protein FRB95_005646 [Tulasnella sp. JGI-2019a]
MSTATAPAPYTTFSDIPSIVRDESFIKYGILAMYFQSPPRVIEPVKYTTKEIKVDLFIHGIEDGRLMLRCEGKIRGGGKDAAIDKAIAEAGKYMSETGVRFGIVGISLMAVFVMLKGSGSWELKLQPGGA